MGTFDVSRLPRAELLAEAFPGQTPHPAGWGKLRCTLPGCEHTNGDRNPSLRVNAETGGYECLKSGTSGRGWRDFVAAWWGPERWAQILRELGSRRAPRSKEERREELRRRWAELEPERAWTERYRLAPDLSRRYLRRGARYPGDPVSETVVGLYRSGELVGAKWRLPDGARWEVGALARSDPRAKYALTKGSDAGVLLLHAEALARPEAALLVCAGEKDALVAASHLGPGWAPVTGTYGEGKVPSELVHLARGRRVVFVYDGDHAGREGAVRAAARLLGAAASLERVDLPQDTPPGKDRPGWDLAEVWEHRGTEALEELLGKARPFDQAELEQARAKQQELFAGEGSPPPGGSPPIDADEGGGRERGPVDDWQEHGGRTWQLGWEGRGKRRRQVADERYAGVIRLVSSQVDYEEDPEEPSGWRRSETCVYHFAFADGHETERCAGPGGKAFAKLIESATDLSEALASSKPQDVAGLYTWVIRKSNVRERVRERYRAIGPHERLGWIAPGGVRVRAGKVERAPFEVAPPSLEPEFERYRLAMIGDEEARDLARWVVSDLLACDLAGGAYTLPLLGAFAAAPLWPTIPKLARWQRYVVFVQGPSGIGKTQLCRYFASLWGDFTALSGLTTWATTATAIENLLHHARDCPVFVSDWKRSQFSRNQMREAMQLIQSYADRSGKGRSERGGAEMQRRRPPRATWVIDGEDLPEGEQSTLGRLVVLVLDQHGAGLAAHANDSTLPLERVEKLPGLTARWIAWVSTRGRELSGMLDEAHRAILARLPAAAGQQSRLARSYAVQQLAVEAWLEFTRSLVGPELDAELGRLAQLALDTHVAMATAQLGAVAEESAGEQFWSTLLALLHSGQLDLAPHGGSQQGQRPFDGHGPSSTVGEYSYAEEKAWLWPRALIPALQSHLSKGGGDRIAFSQKAILQQLRTSGLVKDNPRLAVEVDGRRRKLTTWEVDLADLEPRFGADGRGAPQGGEE